MDKRKGVIKIKKVGFIIILVILIFLVYHLLSHKTGNPIIIKPQQETNADKYIVNKKLILQSLQSQSKIVSYKEDIDKKIDYVDDSFFGKRVTSFEFIGNYQMGLNTDDIKITSIHDGSVYVHLGKPIIISLELPFDKMKDIKVKGYFRFAMKEEEKQKVYKQMKEQIKKELIQNNNVIKTAELYNQSTVKNLIMKFPGVKQVIFTNETL